MYGFLWRMFPGGLLGKLLCSLLLTALVVAGLFLFVFPWVEQQLPYSDVTVNSGTGAPGGG